MEYRHFFRTDWLFLRMRVVFRRAFLPLTRMRLPSFSLAVVHPISLQISRIAFDPHGIPASYLELCPRGRKFGYVVGDYATPSILVRFGSSRQKIRPRKETEGFRTRDYVSDEIFIARLILSRRRNIERYTSRAAFSHLSSLTARKRLTMS